MEDIIERLIAASNQSNLRKHQIKTINDSAEEIRQLRQYIDVLTTANSTLFHRLNRLKKKFEEATRRD